MILVSYHHTPPPPSALVQSSELESNTFVAILMSISASLANSSSYHQHYHSPVSFWGFWGLVCIEKVKYVSFSSALAPCSELESCTVAHRPPSQPRLAQMDSVPTMSPASVSSRSPPEQVGGQVVRFPNCHECHFQ